MLKKISMFALIMSVCGIATAGMPTTTTKNEITRS